MTAESAALRRVEVDGHADALRHLVAEGMTDGLPVVPATESALSAMLAATPRDANEVLGAMPPSWMPVTVEKAAVVAVMAGCVPGGFPFVLAALEAVLDPAFRVQSVQTSTSPACPLLIVNGPGGDRAGIASGTGCFGPGPWPNMAIGRAVRLAMTIIGGGRPGVVDQATMGWPFKVGACFAERADRSPWPPLHVRRGYDQASTTVTAAAVTGAWQISEPGTLVDDVVHQVLYGMATLGHCAQPQLPQPSEVLLVMSPGIAALVADRYPSVSELQHALFGAARVPLDWIPPSKRAATATRLSEMGCEIENDRIPIAESPACFEILVTGGDAGVQSFGMSTSVLSRSVTRLVGSPRGSAA